MSEQKAVRRFTIEPEWTTAPFNAGRLIAAPEMCEEYGDGAIEVVISADYDTSVARIAELERERDHWKQQHDAGVKVLYDANKLIRRAANPPFHDPAGGIGPLKRDLQNYVIGLDRVAALKRVKP
jgi:hypothetical protein